MNLQVATFLLEHPEYNAIELSEAINLFSDESLKKEITDIVKDKTDKKVVLDYFLDKFIKYFKKENPDSSRFKLKKYDWKEGDPAWAKGKELFLFDGFSDSEKNDIGHVLDFIATYSDTELKSLYKEPYETILKKVADWDKSMKNKMGKVKDKGLKEGEDYKVILKGNTGVWVKLLTMKAFKCEGEDMGHCVGSGGYDPKTHDIYALWDSKQESHVTIEAKDKDKEILQVKGKANKAPVDKYIPDVHKFIEFTGYDVINDGKALGLFKFSKHSKKYFVPGSDGHKKALSAYEKYEKELFDSIYARIEER